MLVQLIPDLNSSARRLLTLTFICEDHNAKSDRDHDDDGDVLEELSQQKDICSWSICDAY